MALGTAARVAEGRGDELALTDGEQSLTWREADRDLNRATNALLAMELGEERRIAVFARNAVETLLVHYAAHLAGVSPVPVNAALGGDELAYILRDSGARAVFAGPESVEVAVAAAREAGVERVVAWRSVGPHEGARRWHDWLRGTPDEEPTTWQQPRAALLYTSGTTGRPKGTAIRTQPPPAETVAEWVPQLAAGLTAPGDPHLVAGPLHHTGPYLAVRFLAAGSPVVLLPRFDAERVLRLVHEHRVATTLMVPTHFTRLLALPEEVRRRYDVSSLRWVAHTGAATPVPVKRAMIEWFGPVLFEAYGASEAGTVCAISSEEWLTHPGSVGRAMPGFRVLVLDADGNEVPAGTEGRLFFEDLSGRGIQYHNDPAKTASVHLRPGVFTIGEVGYVDADGYVYITDRSIDMVVSGGVNVYPAEAEQVLSGHPAVRDCAGIGVPDDDLGERLLMLVELDPAQRPTPPDPSELIAFCRERLAHYKCPKAIEYVDTVDRSVMGKLDKRRLRAPYWPTARTIG